MLERANAYGLDFLTPIGDTGVGRCLREAGEFARIELDLILAACDGDLIDVGANIGAISLPFAAARPAAKITAIEANNSLSKVLRSNVLLNRLSNVAVYNVVAGEKRGVVEVPQPDLAGIDNMGARSLYDRGHPSAPTPMETLDSLAVGPVGLIKVDVEGFEPRVLDGASRLLTDVRPNWLVEVNSQRPKASTKVQQVLSDAGYRLYWFFSPFLVHEVNAGEARGDFAIFASDTDPPWDLPSADGPKPARLSDMPYLEPYLQDARTRTM